MPEEELIAYGKVAPALRSLAGTGVTRLSQALVLESGPTVLVSEGETMRYVAMKSLRVKLPQFHSELYLMQVQL